MALDSLSAEIESLDFCLPSRPAPASTSVPRPPTAEAAREEVDEFDSERETCLRLPRRRSRTGSNGTTNSPRMK
jgi:hypothetical protein